jgi:hypothetical protein
MAGAGLLTILVLLIGVPIAVLGDLVRAWRRWRAVPLVQKSHTRSGVGSFVLVALAIYTVKRGGFSSMPDVELYVVAGVAAFATLWLVVGVAGSQGSLRYDPMSLFWYGLLGIAALALLFVQGWPL